MICAHCRCRLSFCTFLLFGKGGELCRWCYLAHRVRRSSCQVSPRWRVKQPTHISDNFYCHFKSSLHLFSWTMPNFNGIRVIVWRVGRVTPWLSLWQVRGSSIVGRPEVIPSEAERISPSSHTFSHNLRRKSAYGFSSSNKWHLFGLAPLLCLQEEILT